MKNETQFPAGCLLLHGYGGSPFEMENLGAALKEAGFAVRIPCLPGHGEGYASLGAYRYKHWLRHAEEELGSMLKIHTDVVVAGFSVGGNLALNLAARFPVAGIVTLSAPVFMLSFFPWPLVTLRFFAATAAAQAMRLLKARQVPEQGETSRDYAPWRGYSGPLHLAQLCSMRAGVAATRRLLPRLSAPICIMQDMRDAIVHCRNAWEIAARVASREAVIVPTRITENVTRHHMIPTHRETASFVEETVVRFCREKTRPGAASRQHPPAREKVLDPKS